MCRVGLHSGMPHRGNRDRRRANGKVEADKAWPGRVSAGRAGKTRTWHKRNQVRVARDAHRIREPGHDGDDLPSEPKLLQGVVDRPREFPGARRHDMTARRVAFGRHCALQQWMADPGRTDEDVAGDEPGPHLGRGRSEHPNLEVNVSIPEWKSILVGLGREAQSDMWRDFGDRGHQGCAEPFYEPFAGANGKGSLKRGDVQMAGMRTEDCAHVTGKQMDPIAKFGGAGCRHKPAPGAYQQRIARRGPKPRQSSTHGGRTQAEASRRPYYTTLSEQRVQRGKQVHVHTVHERTL